jgi:TusE/DsrC/DsvC family sulfur relay protein
MAVATAPGAGAVDDAEDDKFDCEGFLTDRAFWTSDVAEMLARAHGIGELKLSDKHWEVINYVRQYYEQNQGGPPIVRVAKHTGLSLQEFCELFPCGLVKGAYRLAGLPRPPGCT